MNKTPIYELIFLLTEKITEIEHTKSFSYRKVYQPEHKYFKRESEDPGMKCSNYC